MSFKDGAILMINGSLLVFAYICYFYALSKDEASFVAPLFQMVPVFGFVLGYFILGEKLTSVQLIGSGVILLGAIILSLQMSGQKVHVKKAVVLLMTAASLLYAINGVLFRFVTTEQQRFWPSLFWDFLGKLAIGVIIFLVVKSYRKQFVTLVRENKFSILALNGLNEILVFTGEGTLLFATLLAPVAIVQVISGFQPAFVFVYGLTLTFFFPKLGKESIERRVLLQKIIGIIIVILGTATLSLQ